MKPKTFKFEKYNFNPKTGIAVFNYSIDNLQFEEELNFPIKQIKLDQVNWNTFDKALFNLFLIAGISYYKTHCPKKIDLGNFKLTKKQTTFWNKLYTKGLGEFFYQNKIDFQNLINFPSSPPRHPERSETRNERNEVEGSRHKNKHSKYLVPLGGGKDSIVTTEILKKAKVDFDFLGLRKFKVVEDVAKVANKKLINIDRQLDQQLSKLTKQKGVYQGHIPFNAYLAFLSLVAAILYNYQKIVLSNESSANLGNLKYLGQVVNHQYSKSINFENDFRNYTNQFITPDIEYFSMIRALNELEITKKFSQYKKYFPKFSSCNLGNFKFSGSTEKWCCKCSKCVFVWTMLAPFITKKELIKIFGKNLFEDKKLKNRFWLLLGENGFKPFECVGTPEEMKVAMYLTSQNNEYKNCTIMHDFENNILPKIKNIKKLEKQILNSKNPKHNVPKKFLKYLK